MSIDYSAMNRRYEDDVPARGGDSARILYGGEDGGSNDFLLETRLKELSPHLSQIVKNNIFVLQNMLERYLVRFPAFTDHSLLHSIGVLDFCNQLIGRDQIESLCAEECFVAIMACYLHDTGMGIGDKDFEEFSSKIDYGDYLSTHEGFDESDLVRAFHNEFSGHYIRKYANLFEMPSEDVLFAIIQVCRGHRKTDLYDKNEYPDIVSEGGIIRTAYLAAIVRLADEIDVASDRNPEILFDMADLLSEVDIIEFSKHRSIREVEVLKDRIALHVDPISPEYVPRLQELADKIQQTLDYCRAVAESRSDLRISQTSVVLVPYAED